MFVLSVTASRPDKEPSIILNHPDDFSLLHRPTLAPQCLSRDTVFDATVAGYIGKPIRNLNLANLSLPKLYPLSYFEIGKIEIERKLWTIFFFLNLRFKCQPLTLYDCELPIRMGETRVEDFPDVRL